MSAKPQYNPNLPSSTLCGDTPAAYKQNGYYFDAEFRLLTPEQASMGREAYYADRSPEEPVAEEPTAPDITAPAELPPEEPKEESAAPEIVMGEAEGGPEPDPDAPSAEAPELDGALEEELRDMHHLNVAKLVEAAGLTPVTGKDSKSKNIALLLEHEAKLDG